MLKNVFLGFSFRMPAAKPSSPSTSTTKRSSGDVSAAINRKRPRFAENTSIVVTAEPVNQQPSLPNSSTPVVQPPRSSQSLPITTVSTTKKPLPLLSLGAANNVPVRYFFSIYFLQFVL